MRLKIALLAIVLSITQLSQAQPPEDYIKVYGKVLSQTDSSIVAASTMFYEKLPYYDDMGMLKSTREGAYEFHLLKGTKYAFRITQPGFEPFEQQLLITGGDSSGSMEYHFYIEPEKLPDLMTLENLIFRRGSDVIEETSYSGLDELVNFLDERSHLSIQLEGHTDFAGNADANMKLSEARVIAVKEYLVSKGIKKNRIQTKAFGGSQPLSQERTDEAKTRNRRVEVRIIR